MQKTPGSKLGSQDNWKDMNMRQICREKWKWRGEEEKRAWGENHQNALYTRMEFSERNRTKWTLARFGVQLSGGVLPAHALHSSIQEEQTSKEKWNSDEQLTNPGGAKGGKKNTRINIELKVNSRPHVLGLLIPRLCRDFCAQKWCKRAKERIKGLVTLFFPSDIFPRPNWVKKREKKCQPEESQRVTKTLSLVSAQKLIVMPYFWKHHILLTEERLP